MQKGEEAQTNSPQWLKPQYFIDLKDKAGDWRVSYVMTISKSQMRARYDGWPSKYDETFPISSSSIRPFRSVIRGYTGPTDSPGTRDHYNFSLAILTQEYQKPLNDFIENIYSKSQFEINQFIRGIHYTWSDYLMTLTYNKRNQIDAVYQYFFKHFELVKKYLQQMLKSETVQDWFNGKPNSQNVQNVQSCKAFAQCYYQIFDTVYSIMDCYSRLRCFFKNNQALISQFIQGYANHVQFMGSYINQIDFVELLEKVIDKLLNQKNYKINLSFISAFTRLFSSTEKTIKQKQKKKQLTQKLCQIILKQASKMSQLSIKQQQLQLQKIYTNCKLMLLKYNWKGQFLAKFEILNINTWKCMIMSQKLETKIKGISKLKNYYSILTNIHKKQTLMLFNSKQNIDNQIKKQQIINIIFYENQHHQIIKKGCQLVYQLYKQNSVGIKELQIVWKSCRHRLQAVRKVMYIFFESISQQLKAQDLSIIAKLVISQQLVQEIDKTFFYVLLKNVMQSANLQKLPTLKQILQFSYKRLPQYQQQIKPFSQLVGMDKSAQFGLLEQYAQLIVQTIKIQKNNNLFYIKMLNTFYEFLKKKQLQLSSDAFNIIFAILKQTLLMKVKRQNIQQFALKKQKLKQLLLLIQNMSIEQFDLQIQQFIQIWQLFNQEQNQEMREQIFLSWIITVSYQGFLRVQQYKINKCMAKEKQKIGIFNQVLKQHTVMDYVNMSEMEFKIFQKFMVQVNICQSNLTNHLSSKFTMISYFRINQKKQGINGLKQLWDIFLNCRSENVIRRAVKLIYKLYTNYSNQVSNEVKIKKLDQLLNKIYSNIDRGLKKQNPRLIRNSLILLYQLLTNIKQTNKMSKQLIFTNNRTKQTKKNFKIIKDKLQSQLQAVSTDPIKQIKNTICKQFNIPAYNVRLYKTVVQYKVVDDQGHDASNQSHHSHHSNSDASANSMHTESFGKNVIEKIRLQQITKQLYYAPIYTLAIGENEGKIVVFQFQNKIYSHIIKFISERMSQSLLKILADTEEYSKQSSQLSYLTLIQLPKNMQPLQILNNLINKLTTKVKTNKNINLYDQSINFRMYFCKNINRLNDQQFGQFFNDKNIIYQDIFKQINKPIMESLQIQLIIQVINFLRKGLLKNKIKQDKFSSQDIIQCLINIFQYLIGPKLKQQLRKEDQPLQNLNQIKIFVQCFQTLQILHHRDETKIIDSIVQSKKFEKLMIYLYQVSPKHQYSQLFAHKLQKYFLLTIKQQKRLSEKTQQILCNVVFDILYGIAISKKTKKNAALFKIIKNIISIAHHNTIQKLFTNQLQIQGAKHTFWQVCIKIIKTQSDFHNQQQKQNTFFSGHLHILQSIVRKNPSVVSQQLWKLIFYGCLCYHSQFTQSQDIKCTSKGSINAALSLLYAICQVQQKYIKYTVKQLRKYQLTKHWRTRDMWNVNINMEIKSSSGFIGLENPGCICYLNSFTQTLFMNEQFRSKVINFKRELQGKDYSLLVQMRKLFLNLQYSLQKYLDPVPFTKSIKNSQDKPIIKIFQQMDIQQYSSMLFDKIQKLLPKDEDFVKQIFGGTYSNDIISQQCKHCSQRQQNFLSMQLDVKSTLQQSLKVLVKGQILQGQNAYFCEKCNKKVKALKRMSIKKLPNYLIICLKRFQFNFEIEQKIKINSLCQFPKQISFQPYSTQYLNSLSVQQVQDSSRAQQLQSQNLNLPHQYFQYKLKGVIIHTGSADSGHYYAIIQVQSNSQNGKWVQFNDSIVSQFDFNKLADQAFGSQDPTNPKFKNAYMLVYQRRKKIKNNTKMQQKMQQQPQIAQISQKQNEIQPKTAQQTNNIIIPQKYTQQAQQLYKQIWYHNKQIRTYHMMFNNEYKHFITQLFKSTMRNNRSIVQQVQYLRNNKIYVSYDKINTYNTQNPKINKIDGQYDKQTLQQMIKCYLQYNIFVKSRQINIYSFIEGLSQVQNVLLLNIGLPIIDYFIHQLSQQLLIHQLLMEVSFRDKVVVIWHFVWQIIMIRLNNVKGKEKQEQRNKFYVIILKFIQSLLTAMIMNGNCTNEGMYIIRKLNQQQSQFALIFQKIDIFTNIFEILAGIYQSEEDKNSKVFRINSQVRYLIDKMQQRYSSGSKKQTQMSQQKQQIYQITAVAKSGRNVLKQQSPQQAWNYLYKTYQQQSKFLKITQQIEYDRFNQNAYSSPIQSSSSQFNKILSHRRQNFQQQFLKLKQTRITHFIQQCNGSLAAISLSLFLCEIANNNSKILQKIFALIKKRLEILQASKFRSYLILIYHLVMDSNEKLAQYKIIQILKIFCNASALNAKYFSQLDIIHQWVMKLVLISDKFAYLMVRTQEGAQLINQISERVQTHKHLSSQLMKKQKNPTFQRLNYVINGLKVSPDYEDYQKLYQSKRIFFNCLFHQKQFPQQFTNLSKLVSYIEPTYKQLTERIKVGDNMLYMFNRKWVRIFVKYYKYGMLKIHKIVKDNVKRNINIMIEQNIQENKQNQLKQNIGYNKIKIDNVIYEIEEGLKLGQQQYTIWQNDQKLRHLRDQQIYAKYIDKSKQVMENQPQSVSSNLSYQSSSKK